MTRNSKKENGLAAGISEPHLVDGFMANLQHPLLDVAKYIRHSILQADKAIGEGIYWNVPTFYYTGKMEPFNPKEYKRYIVGFNFYKQDAIRLIFLRGAGLADPTRILEGDFKDDRKIVTVTSTEDFTRKEAAFKDIIKQLLELMGK